MKKKVDVIFIIVIFLLTFFLIIFISLNISENKIAYFRNTKILDNFSLTIAKASLNVAEREFNIEKLNLDSLHSKLLSSKTSNLERKQKLNHSYISFYTEQSAKIWTRIKIYSSDFSKENNYQILIGSKNKTNVFFANENIDFKNDLLTYINTQDEGLK